MRRGYCAAVLSRSRSRPVIMSKTIGSDRGGVKRHGNSGTLTCSADLARLITLSRERERGSANRSVEAEPEPGGEAPARRAIRG